MTCVFWAENVEKIKQAKTKAIFSRFAFGFAPAFGRAVGRFAAGAGRWAEAQLYLKSKGKGKMRGFFPFGKLRVRMTSRGKGDGLGSE